MYQKILSNEDASIFSSDKEEKVQERLDKNYLCDYIHLNMINMTTNINSMIEDSNRKYYTWNKI